MLSAIFFTVVGFAVGAYAVETQQPLYLKVKGYFVK